MSRKLTTAEFIHRAKALHGDKYDYSNSEYVSNKVKVSVKCSKHGDFLTSPSDHMAGKGCRLCAYEYKGEKRKLTQAQYLQKLKQVHGDQYDCSKVSYVGADQKIIVTCRQHGDFEIVASAHANGVGCAKCFFERSAKQRMADHDALMAAATKKHGQRFSYDFSTYTGSRSKIKITCTDHGDFFASVSVHVRTKHGGCKACRREQLDRQVKQTEKNRPAREAAYNRNVLYKKRQHKRKTDPVYALSMRMRGSLRKAFNAIATRKTKKTEHIIGCDFKTFTAHIERQFHDGMSWDRISEMHLDHIVPLSTAKTEDEVIALNHFTNIRPMWAKDNLTKGDSVAYLI